MERTENVISRMTDGGRSGDLVERLDSGGSTFIDDQLRQMKRLIRIGTALSAERNIGRLLEMILEEARKFTNADGGTLYVMSDDEKELRFAIIQNDTLHVRMGGTGGDITWSPVPLKDKDHTPNHGNVSAHVALTGNTVNIPDVYDAEGFNFKGTRTFDAQTGYRSKSMLVVPMKNHENDIIGVLQLLNACDRTTGDVVSFSTESQEMTESLASQAAVAHSNNRLIHDLENLMESFTRTIAAAIDEKSPYTGGHVRRVAELTMEIARKINTTREGPLGEVHFSDDELKELHIAAWLHDVGKITIPEYVIDKATKLETIFDRFELLRLRFELCRLQTEIRRLKGNSSPGVGEEMGTPSPAAGQEIRGGMDKSLSDELRFLQEVNGGGERMSDAMMDQVRSIAAREWEWDGKQTALLSDAEVENLNIRQGTLSTGEREIIKGHATITYKMLSQLPFPKKLRNVPEYAASHHETLDGRGYPRGLDEHRLSLQSRILALADVFEALTAKDRPYKKAKTLDEAIQILKDMVKNRQIDAGLFDLFMTEGVHLDYARRELSPQQIDFPP